MPPTNLSSHGTPGPRVVPDHVRQPRPAGRAGRVGEREVVDGRPHLACRVAVAQGRQHVPGVLRQPGGHPVAPAPSACGSRRRTGPAARSPSRSSTPTCCRTGGARSAHTATQPQRHRFDPKKLCRTSGTHQYRCFVKLNAATRSAGRAAPDPAGWGAPALRQAYGLSGPSASTTVAVIVAFDYPSAEADMNHYRQQFGLPACTSASGCFTKLNQKGQPGPLPAAGLRLGRRGLARPPDDLRGLPDLPHRAGRGQAAHRRGARPRRDRGGERRGHGDQPLVRADRADRHRQPGRALRPPRGDRGRLDR